MESVCYRFDSFMLGMKLNAMHRDEKMRLNIHLVITEFSFKNLELSKEGV